MRIFTAKSLSYLILIIIVFLGLSSNAATIVSAKSGSWSDITTWNPQQIPTSQDIVYILAEHTVTVDINAVCSKLIVGESNKDNTQLIISSNYILSVMGAVDIYGNNVETLPTVFNIGDGTLNVGSNLTFYASPGYANLEIASGTINVSGNLDFNASGQGNIKRRTVENAGTINLGGNVLGTGTIEGNQPTPNVTVLPNDYFRSQTSGIWATASSWESSRDGLNNWINVTNPPSGSARRIEIRLVHKITLTQNSPAANLFVYGILDCIDNKFINGPGPFTLSDNATLITANTEGISSSGSTGVIQVDGFRSYSSNANYSFNGSNTQSTGSGMPSILNGILTVDKSDPTLKVTISKPILSTKLVNVIKGELFSNGNLTLESIASSYAQIGELEVNISKVSGDVNVQSFFTGALAVNRGNRMISVPVLDNTTVNVYKQLQQKMVVTGPGGPANGFDFGGGNPNAVTLSNYSEPANPIASFIAVPNINAQTTPGKAVFIFFRGDRTNASGNKVNTPYAVPENVTANYKGTINQGDVSIEIINSNIVGDANNGINAVGNPYPATIDWEKVYTSNSSLVDNVIRIVKPGGGMMTRKVIGVTEFVVNAGDGLASRYIQPGQGFYIQKSIPGSCTCNFTFSESHKAVNNSALRLLGVPLDERLATHLDNQRISDLIQKDKLLRINIQQNDLKDETVIVFKDGFSPIFDSNDAIYFAGNTVLVGSMSSDGKVTSINAMPNVKDVEELKLYVSASASGSSKLNFTDLSAGEGYQIFLRDALFPEKLVDLKKQSTYEFNIDRANVATYGTNRFAVIFKPELVDPPVAFTAQRVNSNVELSWTSQVAKKVNYFEVEVSTDKVSFANIGIVKNAGAGLTSQYSFVDKSPAFEVRFYRLKQFNFNGSVTYTEPRMIDLLGLSVNGVAGMVVYPNPATNKIQIELSQKPDVGIQASIYDIQGKKVIGAVFSSDKNLILELGQLPQGVYLLELKSTEDKKLIGRSKFVVGL